MVDVTEIAGVEKGDEVTLMGRDGDEFIGIEELGGLCAVFPMNLPVISARVCREFISRTVRKQRFIIRNHISNHNIFITTHVYTRKRWKYFILKQGF